MFLLTADERHEITKGLIPRARRDDIPEDLRGWNWGNPPLAPTNEIRLAAWEIASAYCDTSRDLYLRRVANLPYQPSNAMRRGRALHRIGVELVIRVKRMIYANGTSCLPEIERSLSEPPEELLVRWLDGDADGDVARLEAGAVWRYAQRAIVVALQEALSSQPRHTEDSLIAAALPFIMEWKIDGHRVGLSPHLSVDAFMIGSPLLMETKTGQQNPGDRLQVGAYALAAESVYEVPFDLGCISYVMLDGPHARVLKNPFIIDEIIREEVLDARDRKVALIEQQAEPPVSANCPVTCPYLAHCHPSGEEPVSSAFTVPVVAPHPVMPPFRDARDLEVEVPRVSQIEG